MQQSGRNDVGNTRDRLLRRPRPQWLVEQTVPHHERNGLQIFDIVNRLLFEFFCRAGKLLQFVWNCSWWHETARLVVVVVHIQYSDIYIQWHVSCVLFIPVQQLWLCIRCRSRWLLQPSPDYFSDYLQVDSWEILCWKLCQVFSKVEKCTSSVIESILVVQ